MSDTLKIAALNLDVEVYPDENGLRFDDEERDCPACKGPLEVKGVNFRHAQGHLVADAECRGCGKVVGLFDCGELETYEPASNDEPPF